MSYYSKKLHLAEYNLHTSGSAIKDTENDQIASGDS